MTIPFQNNQRFPRPFNDDYDLLGVLGRGGMGYVYKALQKKLNREVALKVLDASSDKEAVERFYLEAQAMKELDHQNLVQVYDFGQQNGQLFIAMTYVKGSTLADVLKNRSRLDFGAIELIAKQVARGLLYAHSKGIIHRDVKPSNIMLTHDNRVYLMDFGISHIQEAEHLTMTGMTMGTPEYMSPEQCHGDNVTIQSDIYSFGVILFEMSCGRLPFLGAKPIEIAMKHVQEQPPAPEMFRPDIPKGLSALILKCLKKHVADRFHDMQEVLDALDSVFPKTHNRVTGEMPVNGVRGTMKNRPLVSVEKEAHKLLSRKVLLSGVFLFPLLVFLLILFMLNYKPHCSFQEISKVTIRAAEETRKLESDVHGGYSAANLSDKDIRTAWLAPVSGNDRDPILILDFEQPTIVTALGFAVGYQKSVDDKIGDRFRAFNKPKSLYLQTREGYRQRIELEDLKGVQYPAMKTVETTEIQIYLDSEYVVNPASDIAISELRILGLFAK